MIIEQLEEPTGSITFTTSMFVATTLDNFIADDDPGPELARDVSWRGQAYRRLDPSYYAWLRLRMEKVKTAHDTGRIDSATFESARGQFNAIHEWAVQRFGQESLSVATAKMRRAGERQYQPPVIKPAIVATIHPQNTQDDVWLGDDPIVQSQPLKRCVGCDYALWWSVSRSTGVCRGCASERALSLAG